MRLIDADKFLENQRKRCNSTYVIIGTCTQDNGFLRCELENESTAYDVDKVIEQLEDEKNHCSIGYYEDHDDYEQGKYDAYDYAIEIVKGGGVNE